IGYVLYQVIERLRCDVLAIGLPNRRHQHHCRLVQYLKTVTAAWGVASEILVDLKKPLHILGASIKRYTSLAGHSCLVSRLTPPITRRPTASEAPLLAGRVHWQVRHPA